MRFPHAQIASLLDEKGAGILKGHWALDRIFIAKNNWLKSCADTFALRRRLQNFSPEITVDFRSSFKSSLAAWFSGAKYRIGFAGPDFSNGSQWLNNHLLSPEPNPPIQRNLQLLETLGICGCSIAFDLPGTEIDRITSKEHLLRCGLKEHFAILNLGEQSDAQLWSETQYAELSRYLLEQWNLPSLVLWSDSQQWKLAEQIVALSQGAAVMSTPVSLTEITELSRAATLFIGPDSNPLHLSSAVGCSCIGLFPTHADPTLYGAHSRCVSVRDWSLSSDPSSSEQREELRNVFELCDELLTELISPDFLIPEEFQQTEKEKTVPIRRAA